jgi:anti-anti-sigma factor
MNVASSALRVGVLSDDPAVVRLDGELDLASADLLHAVAEAVPEGATDVTVDLSGLTFIDGTGADALSALHAAQVVRGRSVRLVKAKPSVRWTLQVLYLEWLLAAPQSGGVRRLPGREAAD